jgi:hypothetical protein
MRLARSEHGVSVMVSNEEHRVLQKIRSMGRVKRDLVPEYYQEIADRLVSRGVLNRLEINDNEYYAPIKDKKDD